MASVTNDSMPKRKGHEEPTPSTLRRWNGGQAMTLSQVLEESDFDTTDYDGKCKVCSDLGGEGNISGCKARSRFPEGKRKDGSDQSGEGNISGGKARNSHEGKRTNGSDPGGEGNISGRKGRSRSPGRAVRMLTSSESEASSNNQ